MLAVPDILALASFTGEPEDGFHEFAAQALVQATLLFSIKTGLSEYPTDATEEQLATNAIFEMAYKIYLEFLQGVAKVKVGPYQSESIGNYSYSKGSVVLKARNDQRTGLMWWDLAMELLATGSASTVVSTGSLQVYDPAIQVDANGVTWVLGPADVVLREGVYDHADTTIT